MSASVSTPQLRQGTNGFQPSAVSQAPARPVKIKWGILSGIALIHLGALLAPFQFTWGAFWCFVVLQAMTAMGITLCYHRLLTHRSFQIPKWLEYFFTWWGTVALQGGPIKWVATHWVHHKYSDRPGDPHSPVLRGFWWAHMLWLFVYDPILDRGTNYYQFAQGLQSDRVHVWIEKTQLLNFLLLAGLLYICGGLPFIVWGIFVRTVFVWHCTWLVNSAAHLWGYQTYDTGDYSRNNWWVALLTYGEGWHNNHHAYMYSARHGLKWWEIDLTYGAICVLGWIGLAKKIRLPDGKPSKLPPPTPTPAHLLVSAGV